MPDEEMFEDPELGDENDPEYKEEMFKTFLHMNTLPEQIVDEEFRKEYMAWLAKQK